jgi:hypothetical protein
MVLGLPKKLVRLVKICLNETSSEVLVGKHLSDSFPNQSGLKQEVQTKFDSGGN